MAWTTNGNDRGSGLAHQKRVVCPPPDLSFGDEPVPEEPGPASADHNEMPQAVQRIADREGDGNLKRMLRAVARIGNEQDGMLVPRQSVVNYLRTSIDRKYQSSVMPLSFLYFAIFMMMLTAHENIPDASQVERQFRGMLDGTSFEGLTLLPVSGHKTLDDIDTVADVYTYIQDVVLPLFIPDTSITTSDNLNRVFRFSRLIGGIQLIQMRKRKANCGEEYPLRGPFDEDGNSVFLNNFQCFPPLSVSSQCFGPGSALDGFCPSGQYEDGHRLRRLKRTANAAKSKMSRQSKDALSGINMEEVFSLVVHQHEGLAAGLVRLKQLKDNAWIDEQTTWIGIRLFIINPDLAVYSSIMVNIICLPSGELIPVVSAVSFMAEPYRYASVLVIDIIWAVLLCQFLWACILSLGRACFAKRLRMYGRNVWTWIDWLLLVMGMVVAGYWFEFLQKLESVKDSSAEVVLNRPTSASNATFVNASNTYPDSITQLRKATAHLDGFLEWYRGYLSGYTILLLGRLFKAFKAQPRLAIISDTIGACWVDMVHFGIILGTIFFTYTFAAMILFGHRLFEFSSLEMASEQLALMLLGNFEYEELAAEFPETSLMWFVSFIVFMYIIILNMALAIIIDVYGAKKEQDAFSDSIWEQASSVFNRCRIAGRVRDTDLLKAVEQLDSHHIGQSALREACPQLPEAQARDLIEKMDALEKNEENQALGISDATKLMVSIKRTLQTDVESQMNRLIRSVRQTRRFTAALQSSCANHDGCWDPSKLQPLHPDVDCRIRAVEVRLDELEGFLNEAMRYVEHRGKEARNRLKALEALLRGQRDSASRASLAWGTSRGTSRIGTPGRATPTMGHEQVTAAAAARLRAMDRAQQQATFKM